MAPWTAADLPSQQGRLACITGANSGIGYCTALALARAGAALILPCRTSAGAESARRRILAEVPAAQVETLLLDLASLGSVRSAAQSILASGRRVDLLVNNAGIMALPTRRVTDDGFELQLATNHFGHFAFTGLLLPALLRAGFSTPARVVTVSSEAHRGATMDFANLQWEQGYRPWAAYRRSKLANVLFGFELDRRLRRAGAPVMSLVVHPGFARTGLFSVARRGTGRLLAQLVRPGVALLGQSPAQAALPTLYAATSPDARSGGFYAPDGFLALRGHPVEIRAHPPSYDEVLAARFWQVSEELTGVRYPLTC